MKVLKREIIYTCEIEWINSSGKKIVSEIMCDNKGVLKRVTGIIAYIDCQILKKEVLKQFKKKER